MSAKGFQDTFLRWAGGKTWFLPIWKELTADLQFRNYYEPFLGGGSVYFSLNGNHVCYLSDMNEDLITTYRIVKENPDGLYRAFRRFKNTEEDYYRVRDVNCRVPLRIAARFLYLNHTSFNGIFRVNKRGKYNVPYGHRKGMCFNKERLIMASAALNARPVHLSVNDFEQAVQTAQEGDLVFFDPPYTVAKEGENGFIEYNEKIFSLEDQRRLSRLIDALKRRGVYYVLTNAAHHEIARIFTKAGDRVFERQRLSAIGGNEAFRGKISEYIFTNIPERRI